MLTRRPSWILAFKASKFIGILGLLLLYPVFGPGASWAVDRDYARPIQQSELTAQQQEWVRQIESLARPLEAEQVMYRYGRQEPCDQLNQAGEYTGEVFDRYSRISQRRKTIAGHGVYIAGNPVSSVGYYEGGATQVILDRGTPVLDLTQ